jgi:hypothetical protein
MGALVHAVRHARANRKAALAVTAMATATITSMATIMVVRTG